jgi:adenosylhomocysteinase
VRRFAAATNLVVAGRSFEIVGSGVHASALAELLKRLGAHPSAEPDYGFVVEPGGRSTAPIVADAGVDADSIATAGLDVRTARRGVLSAQVDGRETFVVPRSPSDEADDAALRTKWARQHMPVAASIAEQLRADQLVAGIRIGVSMVLEPKTAVLALLLQEAGAQVSVFAHPDETDDAVADVLRAAGIPVFANSQADPHKHLQLALDFLDERPEILLDDGSHVIRLAHAQRSELLTTMIGAAEETTSGLRPLRAMEEDGTLAIPVIAVNDARTKTSFDNLYGTGQSCVFAIADLLDASLDGASVVVVGFGDVGKGVARSAAALGATIVVAETDAVRALEATYAGYAVAPLAQAVHDADLVISATGVTDTISLEILDACAPDAVIAVAGGVPQEIAIDAALASGATRETIAHKVERFTLASGITVRILDDGGCINITAAEGNPIDIMDLSFAVQLVAISSLLDSGKHRGPGLYPVESAVDDLVAAAALRASGVQTDAAAGPRETPTFAPRFTEPDKP